MPRLFAILAFPISLGDLRLPTFMRKRRKLIRVASAEDVTPRAHRPRAALDTSCSGWVKIKVNKLACFPARIRPLYAATWTIVPEPRDSTTRNGGPRPQDTSIYGLGCDLLPARLLDLSRPSRTQPWARQQRPWSPMCPRRTGRAMAGQAPGTHMEKARGHQAHRGRMVGWSRRRPSRSPSSGTTYVPSTRGLESAATDMTARSLENV